MLNIDQYLANEARRLTVDQELIDWYKKKHKTRDTPRAGRYTRYTDYSHGSNPYCKTCNEDFKVGDYVYFFRIGWGQEIIYHVDCFNSERESKKRNIIYQDRGIRRRYER